MYFDVLKYRPTSVIAEAGLLGDLSISCHNM